MKGEIPRNGDGWILVAHGFVTRFNGHGNTNQVTASFQREGFAERDSNAGPV